MELANEKEVQLKFMPCLWQRVDTTGCIEGVDGGCDIACLDGYSSSKRSALVLKKSDLCSKVV